eukprot:c52315_g1_i1.p1 GENE.c52315_g1_i1~~c52315_g1_i1.p1  ORF type:complete len:404 (+),score=53.34 c52315_g1_i1:40-1251(+)
MLWVGCLWAVLAHSQVTIPSNSTIAPVLYSVQVSPGPLGFTVADSPNGPIVQTLAENSQVASQLKSGDTILAVDNVVTSRFLAIHLASLLAARSNATRTLTIFPNNQTWPPRTNVSIVPLTDFQELRAPIATFPARSVPSQEFMPYPLQFLGQPLALRTIQQAPQSPNHQFDEVGIQEACLEAAPMKVLANAIEKIDEKTAIFSRIGNVVTTSPSFCRLQQNPQFDHFMSTLVGCDMLWDPSVSCRAIQMGAANEMRMLSQVAETEGMTFAGIRHGLKGGAGGALWPVVIGISAVIAIIFWVVMLVCMEIDCIQMILAASDERLKTDIAAVGERYGIKWYSFRYLPQATSVDPAINLDRKYCGVLAQELLGTSYAHHVVMTPSGYYAVNYAGLGDCPSTNVLA